MRFIDGVGYVDIPDKKNDWYNVSSDEMTNEEMVYYLKHADITVGQKCKTKTAEAIEKALKIIESQPCEDCISRDDAFHVLEEFELEIEKGNRDSAYPKAKARMMSLPSATPIIKSEKAIHTQGFIDGVKYCIEKLNEICHQRV